MSRFNMELPISLVAGDTATATTAITNAVDQAGQQSSKKLETAADKGQKGFFDAAKKVIASWGGAAKEVGGIWLSGLKAMASSAVATLETIGHMNRGVQAVSERAQQAFQFLLGLADQIQAKVDTEGRARWFGATTADAEMLRAKLGDVKSGFEAMSLATELKAGGMKSSDFALFADTINAVAALSGETKASVEQALKSGELADKMISALGKSRAEIEAIVAKAQVAAGGRNLQPLERTQAILRALAPDIQKIQANLGDMGRANPFMVLQKDIQTMWESVSVKLKPSLEEFVKVIQANKDGLVKFFSAAADAAATLGTIATKVFAKIADWLGWYYGKIGAVAKAGVALLHGGQKAEVERIRKWQEEQLKIEMARQGVASVEKIKAAADTAKKVGVVQLTEAQRASNARAAQEKLEARQQTISRMAEARAMIRNYQQVAIDATAAMGGPVAGALNAFKESFEKFKVLGTLYRGTLEKLADASEDEIRRMREAGKISESQAKAVRLFQTYLKAGELRVREYMDNQRAVNVQLSAQQSLLQASTTVAQTEIEQFNHKKEVLAAIQSVTQTIALISKNEDVVSKRKGDVLRSILAQYKEISTERQQILSLALATAKIDKQFEQIRAVRAMKREIEDVKVSTKQLSLELQALLSKEDAVLAAQTQQAQQSQQIVQARQELLRRVFDTLEQIEEKEKKVTIAGQRPENIALLNAQIAKLREVKQQLSDQAAIQNRVKALTEGLAKVDVDVAKKRQTTDRERAQQDLIVSRLQLQQQLLGLQNKLQGTETASLAVGQAKVAIDRKIFDNQQRLLEIEQKRRVLAANPQAVTALDKEAASLKAQNTELQKQLTLQDQLLVTQQRLFTVGGSMLSQLQAQAVDAAQKIGQAAASAGMGLVNSLGGALSSVFEALVTADKDLAKNFGKTILNALGDMAAAFASTFAAVAVGKFALGDIAGGAGLTAASIALFALAGTLKGAGTLVGPQKAEKQTSSTPTRNSLPGQEQTRKETVRETYVIVPSDMLGDPLRQARSLSRFLSESERRTLGTRRRLG